MEDTVCDWRSKAEPYVRQIAKLKKIISHVRCSCGKCVSSKLRHQLNGKIQQHGEREEIKKEENEKLWKWKATKFDELPKELLFHVFASLTPIDWSNLERVSQSLSVLMRAFFNDVVELDIEEDYQVTKRFLGRNGRKKVSLPKMVHYLHRFSSLEALILSGCKIEFDNPSQVACIGNALVHLERLEMIREWPKTKGPVVRKRALNGFNRKFANLQILLLDGSIIKDYKDTSQFMFRAKFLPKLHTVSVRSCFVNMDIFREFALTNQLISLDVDDCYAFRVYEPLEFLTKNSELSLREVNVSSLGVFNAQALALLRNLLHLKTLRILEMGRYDVVEVPIPDDLRASCVELEAFLVPNSRFVNYKLVRLICENCPALTSINLAKFTQDLRSNGYQVLQRCKHLCELNFQQTNIGDQTIGYLTKTMPQIVELNLRMCFQLTDESLRYIVKNCPNMSRLYLHSKSKKISKIGIQCVVDKCLSLTFLEVPKNLVDKIKNPNPTRLTVSYATYV